MNLNKVLLAGNLCADPTYRDIAQMPTGEGVVKFLLAVNRKWKDKDEVLFIDVEAWGKLAANINRFFKKGSPIFVAGRLRCDQWQTLAGEPRQKIMMVAEEMQFVGPAKFPVANPPAAEPATSKALAADLDEAPF